MSTFLLSKVNTHSEVIISSVHILIYYLRTACHVCCLHFPPFDMQPSPWCGGVVESGQPVQAPHSSGHSDRSRNGRWPLESQLESHLQFSYMEPLGKGHGSPGTLRDSFLAEWRGCSEEMKPMCRGKHQRNREKFQTVIKGLDQASPKAYVISAPLKV